MALRSIRPGPVAGLLLAAALPLAACEDMAHALRSDGQIAQIVRDGGVKIIHEEF